FERLPRVRKFLDDTLKSAEEKGYAETLAGRRRPIPELASPEPMVRANAKNIAVNTPVQGSAADVIKRAMIDLDARLAKEGIGGGMILQVHDELVIEVKQEHLDRASAATRESMENAVKLSVPLKVDLGTGASWLDAHG
ncbi:MAG TPA: DNA polymerase, partial [Planctomycetota bacterium]|nr:DNA polymerase [Planctomycetota bacterium]